MNEAQAAAAELRTIRDLIRWGASRFEAAGLHFGHGTDNAFSEASWLVLHALSLPLDLDGAWLDTRVTQAEREDAIARLMQRIELRKPAAYLTGEAWFCDLPFTVNESVLVPRSPIAELIRAGFAPWLPAEPVRVLDLCTGSGCIGIACAYAFPDAEVVLSDVSPEAVALAEANIERHGLDGRVRVVTADLFDGVEGERFDLIVSNPPYVDTDEMAALPPEYHHEPRLGLAAGDDGLDVVRRLLAEAPRHLRDDGVLVVEVGNSQPALEAAFPRMPFHWVEFEQGGHGVFVIGRQELLAALAPASEAG